MKGRWRFGALGAALLCAASAALAPESWAGVVTTSVDTGAAGSLRGEINTASPGDTITFAPGVNPTLFFNDIVIEKEITLAGNGIGQTTITGPPSNRVFRLDHPPGAPVPITIRNMTITGGHAPPVIGPGQNGSLGGAIYHVTDNLIIDGVEFSFNFARNGSDGTAGTNCSTSLCSGGNGGPGGNGGQGGAVYSGGGSLTIRNSSFHDNFAGTAGNGGPGGTAGSSGQGGNGGDGGFGGAGGAVTTFTPTEITNTSFTNNHATAGGNGGAAGSDNFFGGSAGAAGSGGDGGALYRLVVPATQLLITGSTFSGNLAGTGGKGGDAVFAAPGGSGGKGGAIFATNSTFINSTLTANHSGSGGPGGSGSAPGAGGGGGPGGALSGTTTMRASTVAGNQAGGGGTGSPAGTSGAGGGLHTGSSSVLDGSIVANNLAGGSTADPNANCSGTFGGSFDLSFPGGTGCPGVVGDPLLGPLASNGGPTQTMALGTGSPAIDAWPASVNCPPTDQRGVVRSQGPACDVGAFELVPQPAPAPAPAGGQTAFNVKAALRRCKKKFPKGPKRKKCIKKARAHA